MLDISDALRATERAIVQHEIAVNVALEAAGEVAKAEVVRNPGFTPRTGRLQAATQARVIRTTGGKLLRLSNNKDYAVAIDKGAKPHKIVPKSGGFLRFQGRNGTVYARSVNHPGNKPYRFLRNATGTAYTRLEALLEREMQRVAAGFGR